MSEAVLGRLRVVLVETSHPGNIGAVARAMWAMGLGHLHLVRPGRFPAAEATARAAGADEVLYRARVHASLDDALADCVWVVGTSARERRLEWPRITPRAWAGQAIEESARGEVALVFGREQWGLSNEELDRCHAVACIDSNPAFRSLNVAAAVQIFAYELRCATAAHAPRADGADVPDDPASAGELEGLYAHLEQALVDIDYLDPQAPKLLMRRLRRLYGRARLERAELNILRGVLAAAQRAAKGGAKR
ncbi:MAG: RNA methyltransferase [Gammaproteobacteria bacterium]|nr:RNA methyltransferase [Gammaproteobacteria bacterium]